MHTYNGFSINMQKQSNICNKLSNKLDKYKK